MPSLYKEDIICCLTEAIANCEGAIMAAKGGDYLHNFAFMIQEKLRSLKTELEDAVIVEHKESEGGLCPKCNEFRVGYGKCWKTGCDYKEDTEDE